MCAVRIGARHLGRTGIAVAIASTSVATESLAQEAPTQLPPVEVTATPKPSAKKKTAPQPASAPPPSPLAVQSSEPDELPAVPGTVLGSIPAEYAGGQVARGGQIGLLGNLDYMDTPFTTVSYTEKAIRDQQARSVADVLETADAGIRSGTSSGNIDDQYLIRGFRVLNQDIALNGLYGVAPLNRLSARPIDRIEVIKGPTALLNGMAPGGSVGGSINVVTKKADDDPLTRFTTSFSADGTIGQDLDFGRRWGTNKEFGARINLGIEDGDTAVDRQEAREHFGSIALDYRGTRVRVSGDVIYQKERIDRMERQFLLNPGVGLPRPEAGVNISPLYAFATTEELSGMVRGEVDLTENLTFFAAGGFNRSRLDADGYSQVALVGPQGDVAADFGSGIVFDVDRSSAEVGIKARFETGPIRHSLTLSANRVTQDTAVGFDMAAFSASNLYNPVFAPRPPVLSIPPSDATAVTLSSLAVADTMSFFDDTVQLTLGVREQRVELENFASFFSPAARSDESELTPMAGLVVRPLNSWSVYASYIEGLTQGGTAPPGSANVGQLIPPFPSEQIEVGTKVDLGSFGGSISAFRITQASTFVDAATNLFVADGEQVNSGIEASAFGQVTSDVRLLASAMWLDAELAETQNGTNDGNRAVGTAEFYANLGVEWDVSSVPGLTFSGRMIYTGSAFADAANTALIPNWHRFDLGARYETTIAGYDAILRADILNVTDEDYWAVEGLGYLRIGEPRTYRASFSVDF